MMAGPPRVIARARTAVRAALTTRLTELADGSDTTLAPLVQVAVSGGADSLALLATTEWVAPRMGVQVEAVIVDHELHPDSREIAERTAMQAQILGVEASILTAHVDLSKAGGVENAARDARYAVLDQHREEKNALCTLLGHTMDDQAEQVLMGLARGSGARALAGIPRVRGAIMRPFLGTGRDESTALRRRDTEEICTLHGLQWWSDPMNRDPQFLRTRVREQALPLLREILGDHIDDNLARTADLLRADSDFLDQQATELFSHLHTDGGQLREDGDLVLLDVYTLAASHEAIRTRVIRDACRIAARRAGTAPDKSLLRRQVHAVDALVVAWRGQSAVPLPGSIEAARRDGLLVWRHARDH